MADLPPPPAVIGPESENDSPTVVLDWSLWCARHLEPYRAGWPRGAPLAMLRLFNAAVAMPAVADAAGGNAAKLTEALQRFKPVCCFVGREVMERIYAEMPRRRAIPEMAKIAKDDPTVRYRPRELTGVGWLEYCGSCVMFQPGLLPATGTCILVEGEIGRDDVCDRYEPG